MFGPSKLQNIIVIIFVTKMWFKNTYNVNLETRPWFVHFCLLQVAGDCRKTSVSPVFIYNNEGSCWLYGLFCRLKSGTNNKIISYQAWTCVSHKFVSGVSGDYFYLFYHDSKNTQWLCFTSLFWEFLLILFIFVFFKVWKNIQWILLWHRMPKENKKRCC